MPFNPVERAEETERLVMQGGQRKYYRFRAAPYYGGIATADAVGCCFLCAFCWNYFKIITPQKYGKFYTPREVSGRLLGIARKRRFRLCRITGCEPILGESSMVHIVKVITGVLEKERALRFVLETNGLFLGLQPDFISRLKVPKLSVRVAVKGWDEPSFRHITGADEKYFEYPLLGLKRMIEEGLDAWPAVMWDTFGESGIQKLKTRLVDMGIDSDIEIEGLEKYPYVLENIVSRKVEILDRPGRP
ncbi:MAG: radical SAM protein [Candidatus Zixiibacteriota bacterium]|nr:MAG: radical SAM protein [candidate division Zixibacteria bacterium]